MALSNSARFFLRSWNKWILRQSHRGFQSSRSAIDIAYEQAVVVNEAPTRVSKLNNGLRIATEDTGSPTCTVGVWIDAGSRYENETNHGIAHFLEHMLFKGTNNRSQTELERDIESIGAQIRAYTTREQTVFYAKCLSKDVEKAIEILADIIQNPKFDEEHIQRERRIILDEMAEVTLKEELEDHLHSAAFQGTPLDSSILGAVKNIEKIERKDLEEFMEKNYKGPRMVFAGAGSLQHEQIRDYVQKYFGTVLNYSKTDIPPLPKPCRFTGSEIRIRDDDMPLCHVTMAVESCGWRDADSVALMVLNIIVGNWDRANLGGHVTGTRIAEDCQKYGLAHSYNSFNIRYNDTGLFGVYFVSDADKLEDMTHCITQEWMRMCTSLTDFEVERAKNMYRTDIMRRLNGTTQICEDIGWQMLRYARRFPFSMLETRIASMDSKQLREVCMHYLYDRCLAIAAVGPCDNLPDYTHLRSKMFWMRF